MNHAELAERLIAADDPERAALLTKHSALADRALAQLLKTQYDAARISELLRASSAAAALTALAAATEDAETQALAAWTTGRMALQINGQMEQALVWLDRAVAQFDALGQSHTAALVEVNRLHALAMLGRYDEAIAYGLRTRDVFLHHNDLLAAGQIEQNLGNMYGRRGRHGEAEQFLRAAYERYLAIDDQHHLALVGNSLAYTLSLQHRFQEATQLYEQALGRAESVGLALSQAEIEGNLGNLALFQGRYDRALDYLERARRKFAALNIGHKLAVAEQDLADAYLELNLAPEAAAIYTRVISAFAELGMRADQAFALANHGRAHLLLGQVAEAQALLHESHALYIAEGNAVGAAMVTLAEAEIAYATDDYAAAVALAAQAEGPFAQAGTWGHLLRARWLRGEATRARGQARAARAVLESALHDAERQVLPQIAQRCYTSLGLLAMAAGDTAGAEAAFHQAVSTIEALRAPLPAEEFRAAFFADKLTPYTELVRLCLADNRAQRVIEALGYVERARSRALVDRLGGSVPLHRKARDAYEATLLAQLEETRAELNWFYNQINRLSDESAAHSEAVIAAWHAEIRGREARVLELRRQIYLRGGNPLLHVEPLDIAQLQRDLGADTTLVEYFSINGEILAFVVSNSMIEVTRGLGDETQVAAALELFRLQIDTLYSGREALEPHLSQLTARAQRHLAALYDMLFRPLAPQLAERRLVIVPHRGLHYVPFHALYDGAQYVIEQHEICYAPSAQVLRHCLDRPKTELRRAVLFGVPDAQIPLARDEVQVLAPLFPESITLVGEQATLAALYEHGPTADVLHLACHGWFRPDNPLFSSLRLADGALTARDVYELDLACQLAVLSACETGVSAVAPGDELMGLVRGFFAAGVPSLLVSLWMVDDAATATLMADVYRRWLAGAGIAAALRAAQCELLRQYPHPFFWSAFALFGRW
jgi:tetratricopeptide (TPR) repeat protein